MSQPKPKKKAKLEKPKEEKEPKASAKESKPKQGKPGEHMFQVCYLIIKIISYLVMYIIIHLTV